jgi:hypothetical protein
MIRILREAGRNVYVHAPISGGEMLNDTLLGFKTLATGAADKRLVLWIKEYFGPVAREGKAFNQTQFYLDHKQRCWRRAYLAVQAPLAQSACPLNLCGSPLHESPLGRASSSIQDHRLRD